MKFLILWAIVIIADFMLEFRFEFIWPFWLLLRSVHDSFKYKGLVSRFIFGNWPLLANGCLHPDVPLPEQLRLDGVNSNGSRVNMQISNCSLPLFLPLSLQAFSVLFVCIAITSDLICLFFIPVHWLFFAASTYVWVQYVWHTGEEAVQIESIHINAFNSRVSL